MRPGNSDFIILRIPVKTHEIFNQRRFELPCPLYVNYSMVEVQSAKSLTVSMDGEWFIN